VSEHLDIVEVLRRPLETISQCRRMLYVTAEVAEIAAAEIVKLREERRSISTLHHKVESLEAENNRLREERDTLLESEAWGVTCKPSEGPETKES
jgi:hypothetical protein